MSAAAGNIEEVDAERSIPVVPERVVVQETRGSPGSAGDLVRMWLYDVALLAEDAS